MSMDTALQPLAEFTSAARPAQVSAYALEQLKIRLLDTLGVAIGALDAAPVGEARSALPAATAGALATAIGVGSTSAEAAARFNAALVRQLDFHDAYLTPAGVGHPSVGIPAVLAAAELAGASGADLLTALALLYATHTALSDRAAAGAGSEPEVCSVAVAAARALGLDAARTAAAIDAAARIGSPAADPAAAAARVLQAVLGAGQGATGAMGSIAIDPSAVDWARADLEGVRRTQVRQYAADLHAQAPVDLAVSTSVRPLFRPEAVRVVRVKTYQLAFDRLGGGDGNDRYQVRTAAQARRSLPYAVAVALLDRALGPAQYAETCLARGDVQALLRKVVVVPEPAFTQRYPSELRAQLEIERDDGIVNCTSTSTFRGSILLPLTLQQAADKFQRLALVFTGELLGHGIVRCVRELETHATRDLTALLAQVSAARW
jgi:2-methylcitrate dehydratase